MRAAALETTIPFSCLNAAWTATRYAVDEADLVRRVRARDHTAFRELVERYQSRIYRTVLAIVRNHQDAEEIAQDVFAKVYFCIHSYHGRSSLFTWMHRIAVNECYILLRKQRLKFVSQASCPSGLENTADGHPISDRELEARDLLEKLLTRLPEHERSLLLLREVEGLSTAQVAELTGIKVNTLKVKLLRARRKLARLAAGWSRRAPVARHSS